MSDTCKFCGAEVRPYTVAFECGSRIDNERRSDGCRETCLDRYEALFPIPPWSTEPITAGMCERLAMVHNVPGRADKWKTPCGGVSVLLGDRGYVMFNGTIQNNITTAGHLACLIAARKGAVK